MVETLTGTNRSAGLSVQELMAYDTHPVPQYLSRESPMPPGPTLVPAERYHSRDFHNREMERLWKHVWQMACHEDDLPGVGDYVPYEIGDLSFLIVRTAPGRVQGLPQRLPPPWPPPQGAPRQAGARAALPLPLLGLASRWLAQGDPLPVGLPLHRPAEQDLPEVPVGRWGRFIFINPDPDCEPFEEFLDDFPSNFELLPYEKRHKVAEVRKIIRANWKVAQDAFAESWHVFSTHPQVVWGFGDCNAQFDAFKSYSRQHNPSGAPSPHLEGIEWTPLPPSTDGVPRERHAFTGAIYERRPDGNVDVTMPARSESCLAAPPAHPLQGQRCLRELHRRAHEVVPEGDHHADAFGGHRERRRRHPHVRVGLRRGDVVGYRDDRVALRLPISRPLRGVVVDADEVGAELHATSLPGASTAAALA